MKKAARRDGLLSHTKSFASIRRRTAQDDPGTGERLAGSRTSKVACCGYELANKGHDTSSPATMPALDAPA
jgi:hypothetical protein